MDLVTSTETNLNQKLINTRLFRQKLKKYKDDCHNETNDNNGHFFTIYQEINDDFSDKVLLLNDICLMFLYLCVRRKIISYSIKEAVFFSDHWKKIENKKLVMDAWIDYYHIEKEFNEFNLNNILAWLLGYQTEPYDPQYDDFDNNKNSICGLRRFMLNFDRYIDQPPRIVYLACENDINKLIYAFASKPSIGQLLNMSQANLPRRQTTQKFTVNTSQSLVGSSGFGQQRYEMPSTNLNEVDAITYVGSIPIDITKTQDPFVNCYRQIKAEMISRPATYIEQQELSQRIVDYQNRPQ